MNDPYDFDEKDFDWIYKICYFCLVGVVPCIVCGCSTVKEREDYVENHKIESMMAKMDSIINKSQTIQQDTSWHETFFNKLESIKERNDTSHTVVVDSAGKIIKETTIIYKEREKTSESERLEREGIIHRLEKMDSVLSVNSFLTQRIESLLKASNKEKVIEKKEPWYKELWNNLKIVVICLAILFIMLYIVRLIRRFMP